MEIVMDGLPIRGRGAGIRRYTYELLRHMIALGRHDYYISDLLLPLEQTKLSPTKDAGVFEDEVQRLVARMPRLWQLAPLPVRDFVNRRKLRIFRPDVYFGTNFFGLFEPPTKTAITIHDMCYIRYPEATESYMLRHLRKRLRHDAHRADAIFADSEATRHDVLEVFEVPATKVHTVYCTVSSGFRPLDERPDLGRVRTRYSLPERFLLFVGTVEPRKNLVRLLQAFDVLCQAPSFSHGLVIVGDKGWNDRPILDGLRACRAADRIVLTGHVSAADLPVLYNLADALVMPSLYEGFGLPVLEAMACGTPVVTSNVSSLPEVAGDAAVLVDPLSVESMVEGTRRVVTGAELRDDLKRRGLQRAAEFTWEKAARQVLDIFEQVSQSVPRPHDTDGTRSVIG